MSQTFGVERVEDLGGVQGSFEALTTLEEFGDVEDLGGIEGIKDLGRAVETIDKALDTIENHW